MMKIVFQNLFGGDYEGGANWLEASLYGIGLLPQPPTCLVWGASRKMLPTSLQDAAHVRPIEIDRPVTSSGRRLINALVRRARRMPWEDAAITRLASEHKIDLWVGFSGFEGLGTQRPLLVWHPDFQSRHFPEYFDAAEIRDRERQWNYVAARADGIIVISQSVAADALATHPQIADKLYVCGFPPAFPLSLLSLDPDEVRRKYHLPESFFLVSNQFWQHKNHALVFRALSHLKRCGKVAPVIAFTGRPHDYRRPDAFSDLLQFVEQHGLHEQCHFLGVVARADQVALIRAAQAVIQPSKFEGRGAIAEEATVLGTQLLCSDLPVHRELNVPGALFFGVEGVEELAALMQRSYPRSKRGAAEIAEESRRLARAYGEHFKEVCGRVAGRRRLSQARGTLRGETLLQS